jgi:CPA2 family monovalent cation:H+ antiporter-2
LSVARTIRPDLYILVRTRFVAEVEELTKLGANEVIPEEFETSIEIFARVLARFQVPRNVILDLVGRVRGDTYDMLRGPVRPRRSLTGGVGTLAGVELERLLIKPGSVAAGQTIAVLAVRSRTGATILAVQRGSEPHSNPAADFRLQAGDVVLVMGDQQALDAALALIDATAPVA